MRVEIGPVPTENAVAWFDYATNVISELRASPRAITTNVIDAFSAYVDTWRATATENDEIFRWVGDASPENVEYLVFALYRLGVRFTAEEENGVRAPRPEAATKFHKVLVRSLLGALEREGEAEAHFARQLREVWGPANDAT
jgi:hypothetical protein